MSDPVWFVFVGERPSERAAQLGATWENGKLCAKNLREAITAAGFDPDAQRYMNLWQTPGVGKPPVGEVDRLVEAMAVLNLLRHAKAGATIVAMGWTASQALERCGVPHRRMVHPAARGAIRRTEHYQAHVRRVLVEGEQSA